MTFAAVQDGQSLKTLLLRSNPKNVWRSTKLICQSCDITILLDQSDWRWQGNPISTGMTTLWQSGWYSTKLSWGTRDILFWRKWDGGRVRFICITVRHAQMKNIKRIANAVQSNIIQLFSFSILLKVLSVAKVIFCSHWQWNFLVIRLFDYQIRWYLLPILLSCTFVHRSYQRQESHLARLAKSHGANYGKPKPGSESEKRSFAYQVDYQKAAVNDFQGQGTLWRHERAHDDFVVLWLLINQKEVIKECVYMCQMVAQFGTR